MAILANIRRSRRATAAAYTERVNLAIEFIEKNPGRRLRLNDVARAAMFSPHHFHRVFQAMTGERLGDYIRRRRLDRALGMMVNRPAGRKPSLTRIAAACGFASPSEFSRSFKQRFGASPRTFDSHAWRRKHSEELEAIVAVATENSARAPTQPPPGPGNPDGFKVKIRDLPQRTVAYIRVLRPYRGDAVVKATQRLVAWAERHGLAGGQWLGYQWDNPEITRLDDCQYYTAVAAERFTPRGEIGRFRFPPMTVAEVEITGGIDLELRALQWLYGTWLPRSGYVPDDHPAFEAWNGRPFAHGMAHFELRVQIPVRWERR